MAENFIEAEYDLTKKSKIKKFYESNKILILSFVVIVLVLLGSALYYFDAKERKRIELSSNYVQAKFHTYPRVLLKDLLVFFWIDLIHN